MTYQSLVCVIIYVCVRGLLLLVVQPASSCKEKPVVSLLHTLRVQQPLTERAAQSCQGVLHRV